MNDTIKLEIVSPSGVIFNSDVVMVTLPGKDGEFGVLAGHSSLLSLLQSGTIEVKYKSGNKDLIAIDWGFAKINPEGISVLVNGAVHIFGENNSALKDSMQKAKDLLTSISSNSVSLASTISKIDKVVK